MGNSNNASSKTSTSQEDGRIRVLLADDSELIRMSLRSLLQEAGDIEVLGEATDGKEAVILADKLHPDVIVMDLRMPTMDGLDATCRIKRRFPSISVIAFSNTEDSISVRRVYEAGADRFVSKRSAIKDLIPAIRAARTVE